MGFPWRAAWSQLAGQRSLWWILVAWVAETIGFGVVLNHVMYQNLANGSFGVQADSAQVEAFRDSLLPQNLASFGAGAVPFYGAAMALVIGALVVGNEYRHGTVRVLYTQGPGRLAVIGSQLVALAAFLGIMTVATYAADYIGLVGAAEVRDWPVGAPQAGPLLVAMGSTWLMTLAYGLVGAALAVATRGTLWSLTIGLLWILGVDTLLIAIAKAVPWLTGPGQALIGAATSNLAVANGSYPWWPAVLSTEVTAAEGWIAAGVLAAWSTAAVAAALFLVKRRDIGP
jgi:ABC-type transport system involved in multi-copper enzyme maturation permease subunit